MKAILINNTECIGCGQCAKACVTNNIHIENEKARIKYDTCIECEQCYVVCPKDAIAMTGYAHKNYINSLSQIDESEMLLSLKSKGSITYFKDKKIDYKKLEKIIEAGQYGVSTHINENISYTIITGNKMEDIEDVSIKFFQKILNIIKRIHKPSKNIVIDDNFFFKNAPAAIMITRKRRLSDIFRTNDYNTVILNMQNQAESMGLGVLFNDYTIMNTKINLKVRKILKMELTETPVACLIIGYPKTRETNKNNMQNVKINRIN